MFSFHKPKIYRSNLGCCICKAKSSSSRFTDSKKYEEAFERCFLIKEIRTGEICNACVLLVKRCKKLPKEATKHWAHVVDARQGHKSNNKTKSSTQTSSSLSSPTKTSRSKEEIKKVVERERKICEKQFNNSLIANENESNNVLASSLNDEELKLMQNTSTAECDCSNCAYNRELDELEKNNQQLNGIRRMKKTPKKLTAESISNSSSGNSSSDSNEEEEDEEDNEKSVASKLADKMMTRSGQTITSVDQSRKQVDSARSKSKRKQTIKHLQRNEFTFLDMTYWKREQVCCGIIFRNNENSMVLIDRRLYTPCSCRKSKQEPKVESESDLSNKMEVESSNETDNNNNLSASKAEEEDKIEIMTVNIPVDLNETGNDDAIDDLVVVNINSSSGISSDGSDVSSVTEEEEVEEDGNEQNLISDHDLMAKSMLQHTNRSFGVL